MGNRRAPVDYRWRRRASCAFSSACRSEKIECGRQEHHPQAGTAQWVGRYCMHPTSAKFTLGTDSITRTVGGHIRNILNKTSTFNRAEAAVDAARQGLVQIQD